MSVATQRASAARVRVWHRTNSIASRRPAHAFGVRTGAGVVCLLLLIGCSSHSRTETAVVLEEPRVKNGVIVEPNDPAKLDGLAAAVDAIDLATPRGTPASDGTTGGEPNQSTAANQGDASPARVSVAEAVDMTARRPLPPESMAILPLPKLSRTEINEIVEHLVLGFESSHGYVAASPAVADAMPIAPPGILGDRVLARPAESGTHVLRFGYRCFISQPPQFWAVGVVVEPDGTLSANPDLTQVEPRVTQIMATLREMRVGLTVRELETRLIQLSYVDAATAINMLKGFGVTTLNQPAEVPANIEFDKLPYVVNIEDPKKEYTGLVGSKEANSDSKTSFP